MIRTIYNRLIRERLPRKRKVLNGVVTRKARLLDLTTVNNGYEGPLIRYIRESVRADDTCLIIGGGWGVSAVAAARIGAEVIVYEGSLDQLTHVQDTLRLNGVQERVDLRKGLVSGEGEFYGERGAESVEPDNLPDADVLVMDCEGAELGIIRGLEIRPRTIIVESHGHFGAPTRAVTGALEEQGYDVLQIEAESEETDVMVILATHER